MASPGYTAPPGIGRLENGRSVPGIGQHADWPLVARAVQASDHMEHLTTLAGVIGAWSAASLLAAIGWSRFHKGMGERPRPQTGDRTHTRAA